MSYPVKCQQMDLKEKAALARFDIPSSPQILHVSAGLSGQSARRCPSCPHWLQVPVNARSTRGLGQSALLWPTSPQLKHSPEPPPPSRRGSGQSRAKWPSSPQLAGVVSDPARKRDRERTHFRQPPSRGPSNPSACFDVFCSEIWPVQPSSPPGPSACHPSPSTDFQPAPSVTVRRVSEGVHAKGLKVVHRRDRRSRCRIPSCSMCLRVGGVAVAVGDVEGS